VSDIVLGMIIGGVIGVVGSALVALIQGHYSLKSKREENLAREHQLVMQIQHEKDSQLLSRRIAVRSKYLEPLSSHLSDLYASFKDRKGEVIAILRKYSSAEDKIHVREEDKEEFYQKLDEMEGTIESIGIVYDKTSAVMSKVTDDELTKIYNTLLDGIILFYKGETVMYRSLGDCKKGEDFVYDFEGIVNAINKVQLCIENMHRRIESLLAGGDAGDE
jgi:hypothetical protein